MQLLQGGPRLFVFECRVHLLQAEQDALIAFVLGRLPPSSDMDRLEAAMTEAEAALSVRPQ